MLRHYLWHIHIVVVAILGVVTALNISQEIALVWAEGAATSRFAAAARTGSYVLYRILDNGSQVFPVAFVLGVAWAEIAHAQSGRKTMVRTVGLSHLQGSAALLIIVAVSVPVQFMLDNVVRPYAFMSLSLEGLGEYGWDYARQRENRMTWLSFGDTILQVRMQDDPDPVLRDATLYRFSSQGDLKGLTHAQSLQRGPNPGEPGWHLLAARSWELLAPGTIDGVADDPDGMAKPTAFGVLDLDFPINSLWLEYRGIAPKYIPLRDLAELARQIGIPDDAPKYREWLHIRSAQALNPGLIALSVCGVFFLLLDRFGLLRAAGAMIVTSYVSITITRVMAVVAEHQAMPVAMAVWLPPLVLLAASISIFVAIRNRDRRYQA